MVKSPKKRTYNPRLVKSSQSYTIYECAELFGVSKKAVFSWVKMGLPLIDDHKPHLILGWALINFIKQMQKQRKKPCQPHEFFCCKCRQPREAKAGSVYVASLNQSKVSLKGICTVCDTCMHRIGATRHLIELQKMFAIVTPENLHITDTPSPNVNFHIQGTDNG